MVVSERRLYTFCPVFGYSLEWGFPGDECKILNPNALVISLKVLLVKRDVVSDKRKYVPPNYDMISFIINSITYFDIRSLDCATTVYLLKCSTAIMIHWSPFAQSRNFAEVSNDQI